MKIKHEKYELDLSAEDGYLYDYMTSKGYFPNAKVSFMGKKYLLNIYDRVRLRQDLESECAEDEMLFFEKNILVLNQLTFDNIKQAIGRIIESDEFKSFVSEIDNETDKKSKKM